MNQAAPPPGTSLEDTSKRSSIKVAHSISANPKAPYVSSQKCHPLFILETGHSWPGIVQPALKTADIIFFWFSRLRKVVEEDSTTAVTTSTWSTALFISRTLGQERSKTRVHVSLKRARFCSARPQDCPYSWNWLSRDSTMELTGNPGGASIRELL
jgi:hypothetical protein